MKRVKYRGTHHPKAETANRPRWLIPAVIAVAALLVVGGVFRLLSRGEAFTPEVTGRPSAVLSQESFDYGEVKLGTWLDTSFTVKNVGDAVLMVLDQPYIEVVEGCCPPDVAISSTRLNPGEEATVSMRWMMHGDMGGPHDFRLHVSTNDPVEPEKEVVILSNWVA